MKVVYFDCFSGVSGDMTLAALVDAGANPSKIEQGLERLFDQKVQLSFEQVVKKGVSAKKLKIIFDGDELVNGVKADHHHHQGDEAHHHDHHHHTDQVHSHEHHDGDHAYGDHDQHTHYHFEVVHSHDHHHGDAHTHDHQHHHYSDIVKMIQRAGFVDSVSERALQIFLEIGKAEAKIHDIPLDEVHFHEVGAVDSIIDIVGAALALEDLGVERVIASPVAVGSGYVKCDHGLYPVPAPATLEMLKNVPIRPSEEKGELTTPTGAGILAALSEQFGPLPAMTVRSIGYGAGTKELKMQPNVLRVVIGEME